MYSKEEAQQIRHEFWHKLESKSRKVPGQNGKAIKWIGDKTGVKGLDLRFDVDREKAIVALEINTNSEEKQNAMWEKMNNCKALFEKNFGGPLVWERNYEKASGEKVIRIYVETAGDLYNKDMWSDMLRFMIDNMIKLEKAFREVQDYLIHF
ncbi:MAG: DUF4268 domain-containing protein [Bacteroidales bacterium]|nr:DUF4268 domain-containing protein [Bacteroidales bacterium]